MTGLNQENVIDRLYSYHELDILSGLLVALLEYPNIPDLGEGGVIDWKALPQEAIDAIKHFQKNKLELLRFIIFSCRSTRYYEDYNPETLVMISMLFLDGENVFDALKVMPWLTRISVKRTLRMIGNEHHDEMPVNIAAAAKTYKTRKTFLQRIFG